MKENVRRLYASATAIARLANELKSQYPKSRLNQIACPNANDVYRAGTDEDELALEDFRQAGFYLGVALAGLVNVLNPEMIVVGGGASAGWKLFLPELKKIIGERSYKRPARTAQISLAALGDDARLVGAARIAFDLLA